MALDPTSNLAGEVKFTEDTTLPQLGATQEAHRKAILDVAGDAQRLNERLERMLPETQKLLAEQRANVRGEWAPSGDVALAESRYLRDDGSVQIGPSKRTAIGIDGLPEEVVTEGYLSDPQPVTQAQANAQRAARAYAIAYSRAIRGKVAPARDKLARGAFARLRTELQNAPGRIGAFFTRMFADTATFKRVMDGSAGLGGELVGTPTLSALRMPRVLTRRLPSLIGRLPAPSTSFKRPVKTGRMLFTVRSVTTDDPAPYPKSNFTTSDDTLTIKDYVGQVLIDPVWVENASILFDAMGEVAAFLAQGVADTEEAFILHGDTAGTHQDTLSTWTLDSYFTAGQLDGSNSALKSVIGVRGRAIDNSKTGSAGGTFDAADHFGSLAAMGTYGSGAVMIAGLNGFYTQILANSLFTTVDKFGPSATLLTGQLGAVGDTPIIISQFMPKEFDTSSGVYTGSNKGNEFVYMNPSAWAIYELIGGDSWDVRYPERGAQYVGEMFREILANTTAASTEYSEYVLYNL